MELFRLDEVLVNDKFSNISEVARLLEHEITPILKNYLSLSQEVVIRYKKCGNGYRFMLEVDAERIKPFGKIL